MVDLLTTQSNRTVLSQLRRSQIASWFGFTCLLAVTGLIGLQMLRAGPSPSMFAWLVYFSGVVAIVCRPRYGVYLIFGLSVVSDRSLLWWYPFTKNFSSAESLLYLNNAVIISPLESYIALTFLAWLGIGAMQRKIKFSTGPLFWPALLFGGFIASSLVYGVLRGGNPNIALWEARPILYLPAVLILTSNLIEKREHVNCLLWITAIALFIKGIFGTVFVATVLQFDLAGVERIGEHSMSIQFNSLYVMAIAVWLYRDSVLKRIMLPAMLPVVLLSYIANNRRASFIAMGIALVLLAVILYRERRRMFWTLAPIAVVLAIGYLAVFWNSTGTLGAPAQAVKSVIGEPDPRDAASNVYREIENINSLFTIQAAPLLGIGFGNKFYIIAPMPDISFFEWWEYITHNSIMWIWMKAGLGGFMSMLLLIGLTIVVGVRTIWRMPGGALSVAATTMTIYVFMHFVYAYVDMSWEAISMVYVGVAMGLINCLQRIAEQADPLPEKRWPWQPEPLPTPGPRSM